MIVGTIIVGTVLVGTVLVATMIAIGRVSVSKAGSWLMRLDRLLERQLVRETSRSDLFGGKPSRGRCIEERGE